jgi:hypothetical protein
VSKQAFFRKRVLFRKNTTEHQLDVVVTSALTLGAWCGLLLHASVFLRTSLRHASRPLAVMRMLNFVLDGLKWHEWLPLGTSPSGIPKRVLVTTRLTMSSM